MGNQVSLVAVSISVTFDSNYSCHAQEQQGLLPQGGVDSASEYQYTHTLAPPSH